MNKSSVLGVDENIGGVLAYCGPMPVVFLAMKESNEFIRFHSMQALFVGIAGILFWAVLNVVFMSLLGMFGFVGSILQGIASTAIGLGFMVLWILCIIKAYQGERWKLPIVGDLAEKQLAK